MVIHNSSKGCWINLCKQIHCLVIWVLALTLVTLSTLACSAHAAPDEELLGKSRGYPVGTLSNWFYDESVRVGSFSNLDKISPHNVLSVLPRTQPILELPQAAEAATFASTFRYPFEGKQYSIEDYLQHQRVTGLLIIKDGKLLLERYQYDRTPTHRLVSHSMAKSIVSLAIGMALQEGKIRSLDDTVATYVPQLKGYAYGETKIRHILRMASGVRFTEVYDGKDDLTKFSLIQSRVGSLSALQAFNEREAPEGQRFHYASIETQVLAMVLREVTGMSVSAYLTEKLWKPMGAEANATWSKTSDGLERASGNFSATLRDWGRLGVLLANDGQRLDLPNQPQILPKDYLLEATDWHRHPAAFAPRTATSYFGYGYQFWIFAGEHRRFALRGVYGQTIYVDPEQKLVLVQTAVAKNASIGKESMLREMGAVWLALVNRYGAW